MQYSVAKNKCCICTSVEKELDNYTVLRSVDSDADNACSGVFLMSKLPLRGGTWSAWENDEGSRVMLWKPINPISYVEVISGLLSGVWRMVSCHDFIVC